MGARQGCIWHAGKSQPFLRRHGAGRDAGQGTKHRLALLLRNKSLSLQTPHNSAAEVPTPGEKAAAPNNARGWTDLLL